VDTQKLRRFLDHCSLPPSFELAFAVSQRARADMQHAWKESDVSVGAVHFRHDHDGQMAVRAMLIKPNKELTKLYKAVETLEHEALQARDAMSREVIDRVGKLNVAASKISTSYEEELSAVRHEAQVTQTNLRHDAKVTSLPTATQRAMKCVFMLSCPRR